MGIFGRTGSAPSPFDAINGTRLAGPQGSHPLHDVRAEELLRPSDGSVSGEIVLAAAARVGDGLTGRIGLVADRAITARGAVLRLVGLRLDEVRRSHERRDSQGRVVHREEWVEAQGRLFEERAFLEPAIPARLEAGQAWDGSFAIPAPRLGPPSAHLGESIVAWALEVRWDVRLDRDPFLAVFLPVAQNRDLIMAGVGRQGGQSMMTQVPAGDGSIAVESPLPAVVGSAIQVRIGWPSAPNGQGARVELHRRTNAPNGENRVVATTPTTPDQLRAGGLTTLQLPPDVSPSFDGAGLEVGYVIRALVDRRFRPDAAIERPVAVL